VAQPFALASALSRAVLDWGPAVLWAAVLFFLSGLPEPPGASIQVPGVDKLGHFGLYVVLGALLCRGREAGGTAHHGLVLLVGALYAASDEWHQSFVPGRQVSALDWAADLAGLAAGYGALLWLIRRRRAGSARPTV